MTKEEEVLKRLDKEINPYSLSVLKSYAKETAIEFGKHINEKYYGSWGDEGETEFVFNEWIEHKEG